jgi:hypothetical protein
MPILKMLFLFLFLKDPRPDKRRSRSGFSASLSKARPFSNALIGGLAKAKIAKSKKSADNE